MMENEKEKFEFEFEQHKHSEIVSALRSISFQTKESEILQKIAASLDELLKKEFLPEFSTFSKELNSLLKLIEGKLEKDEAEDNSEEEDPFECLAELLKANLEEMRRSADQLSGNTELLKQAIAEKTKPRTFKIIRDKLGRISEVEEI